MMKKIVFVMAAFAAAFAFAADGGRLVVGVVECCSTSQCVSVQRTYIAALEKCGYAPVVLPFAESAVVATSALDKVDILLLTGGEDVAPARYRKECSPRLGEVNLRRDDFEWKLLEAAKKRRMPVFGICRGEQVLNVFFGGTLVQDIPSEHKAPKGVEKAVHRAAKGAAPARHMVTVVPDTRLAAIVGRDPLEVNSFHHQAVETLAPGFVASAIASDGVIEAIESIAYPAAGVQFHPEKMLATGGFDTARVTEIFARLPELVGLKPMRDSGILSDILESTDDATLLKAFIGIPSATENIPGVNRASEAMAAHLRKHGLKCTIETMDDGRKVLFACSRDTKTPDVLISAHIDTVPPQSPSMYFATVTNGVMYGRGASDCKGHCVLSAHLLRALKDDVSIGCIFGSDEEKGGRSTEWMVQERGYGAKKVIFVFDMEPYSVTTKQKGLAYYKVTAKAEAVHAGLVKGRLPKNALERILEGRERLKTLFPEFEDGSWRDVARVTSVNGGTTKAEAGVSVRNSKMDWTDIDAKIAEAFPGCEIESRRKSPAVLLDESEPVMNEFLRRTKLMCEKKGFKYDGYYHLDSSTDARHLQYMGLPMIITGTDCHGAHTPREHMILSSMQDYFELVSEFLLDLYRDKGK